MAGAVRQPIDLSSLSAYLEREVQAIKLPVSIKQFGYGQSNPTYQITASDSSRYVLRKKPPGELLSKTAHQVEREYRVIHRLHGTDVPVPRTYSLCEDPAVIGTPFYIMEFLDGRMLVISNHVSVAREHAPQLIAYPKVGVLTVHSFEDPSFPGVTARERREMWHDAVRTLGSLHRVIPSKHGLSDYGKANDFYGRQIKTLATISASQAQAVDKESGRPVGKIPHFDEMVTFFKNPRTQPADRSSIVHGDYKIDNLVYHKTDPRVIGILDTEQYDGSWEMSTIGHPLSDLSNLLSPFTFALHDLAEELASRANAAFSPSSAAAGLPSRIECIEWYIEATGWDPRDELQWGDSFGVFRNSVIMQGIAARYALRQASSEKAQEYAAQMGPFGEFAWELVRQLEERDSGERAKL